jgi:hypothetical protein
VRLSCGIHAGGRHVRSLVLSLVGFLLGITLAGGYGYLQLFEE